MWTQLVVGGMLALAGATTPAGPSRETDQMQPYARLQAYVQQRSAEFDAIPRERRAALMELAGYVRSCVEAGEPCRLTFICTHNSRRSHLSQIWAATAAAHHGVPNVHTYSGGTEATAFNPRAVAALQRAGFDISRTTDDRNSIYHVRYATDAQPLTCFSKVYNQAPNPQEGFGAVMVCSDADRGCPVVRGAVQRWAIPFEDPKAADNTDQETQRYDERCAQIAREMLYVFAHVRDGATDQSR